MNASARLIVVSNRLPMTIDSKDDERTLHPSSGGLISALTPLLKNSGGYRVGWKAYDDALPELIAYWADYAGCKNPVRGQFPTKSK